MAGDLHTAWVSKVVFSPSANGAVAESGGVHVSPVQKEPELTKELWENRGPDTWSANRPRKRTVLDMIIAYAFSAPVNAWTSSMSTRIVSSVFREDHSYAKAVLKWGSRRILASE